MTARTAIPTGARANGAPDLRDLDLDTLITLYPSKLEPMPDGTEQLPHFVTLIDILMRRFKRLGRVVGIMGDSFIYYTDESGGIRSVAPDVCISFDVDTGRLERERSYFVERMGKPPDLALEIGSPSAARSDLEDKPHIYATIGIPEYWMFDATGGRYYDFPLRGLRLVDGEYAPIEMTELPDGSMSGHSESLGLTLLWKSGPLRLIDPATQLPLETSSELEADRDAAQRRIAEAEAELEEMRRRLRER